MIERRAYPATLTLRTLADGGRKHIVGHAALFNSLSEDFGGWRERIAPGAFARTLREGQDVVALFDHDTSELLGRRSAKTLNVYEDDKGLAFEIDPPDVEHGRKVVHLIERGDLRGASFAFTVVDDGTTRGDRWDRSPDGWVRTLLDVDLFDVSPVTFPAYPATDVGVRGLERGRTPVDRPLGLLRAIALESAIQVERAHRTRLAELT